MDTKTFFPLYVSYNGSGFLYKTSLYLKHAFTSFVSILRLSSLFRRTRGCGNCGAHEEQKQDCFGERTLFHFADRVKRNFYCLVSRSVLFRILPR